MNGDYPSEFWRRLAEALNAADLDALEAMLSEDAVFDWTRSRGPYQGIYEGQSEIQAFWDEFLENLEILSWEEFDHTPIDGERMLVSNRWRGRGRESGVDVETRGAMVYTVRDHKIIHLDLFQSREEALAELGLRSGQAGD